MNKKIGAVLALVLMVGIANATIFKNFEHKGQIDILGYYTDNVSDAVGGHLSGNHDEYRNALVRVIFGTTFDLTDDVGAGLTFVYGGDSWNGNATGYFGQQPMGTLTTTEAAIEIAEAYVTIADLFMFDSVKIGKQYYGTPQDFVAYFGPIENDSLWHSAIDAVKANYTADLFDLEHYGHFVHGRGFELDFNDDDDISFWGWRHWTHISDEMHLGLQAFNGRIGLYSTPPVGAFNNDVNLWVVGVKLKGEAAGFDYFFEFDKNFGQDETNLTATGPQAASFIGYALLAKLAYHAEIEGVGGIKPRGMFFYGSGDNEASLLYPGTNDNKNFFTISSDFRPGEIFGNAGWLPGAADTFAASGTAWYNRTPFQARAANLQVWNLGIDWMPEFAEQWTFMVDGYKFFVNSSSGIAGNDHIGAELDLVAHYDHNENVGLKFVAAKLWPGSYIKNVVTAANNAMIKLAAHLNIKFGSN